MSAPTVSELIGELRRMAKVYEAFRRAEDVVRILANYEQIELEAKKRIADIENQAKQAEMEVEDKLQSIHARLAEAEKSVEANRKLAEDIKREAEEQIAKAGAKAADVIRAAQDKAAEYKETLDDYRRRQEALIAETGNMEKVLEQMETKRKEFLANFGK